MYDSISKEMYHIDVILPTVVETLLKVIITYLNTENCVEKPRCIRVSQNACDEKLYRVCDLASRSSQYFRRHIQTSISMLIS